MTKPSYKQWIAACTLTSTLLLGACGPAPVTRDASIVPLPNQIQQSGNAFVLTPNTTIGTTDPELQPAAQYLKEILSAATGYDLQVKEGKTGNAHQKVRTHIGSLGAHRGDDRAELSAAEVEVLGRGILRIHYAYRQHTQQVDNDGNKDADR